MDFKQGPVVVACCVLRSLGPQLRRLERLVVTQELGLESPGDLFLQGSGDRQVSEATRSLGSGAAVPGAPTRGLTGILPAEWLCSERGSLNRGPLEMGCPDILQASQEGKRKPLGFF